MKNQLINKLIIKYGYVEVIINMKLEELKVIDQLSESQAIEVLKAKDKILKSNEEKNYQPTLYYIDF